MFSDKYRLIKIIVLILLILGLCSLNLIKGPEISPRFKDYLSNFDKYVGQERPIGYTEVTEINKEEFKVYDGYDTLTVKGIIEGVKVGDTISIKVLFKKENIIELKEVHLHKFRRWKHLVSIPPILFILFLLLKDYKFDWRKGVISQKP